MPVRNKKDSPHECEEQLLEPQVAAVNGVMLWASHGTPERIPPATLKF